MIKKILLASTLALAATASAQAACDINSGRVSIVGNEFPAIQTIGKGAMACAGAGV